MRVTLVTEDAENPQQKERIAKTLQYERELMNRHRRLTDAEQKARVRMARVKEALNR